MNTNPAPGFLHPDNRAIFELRNDPGFGWEQLSPWWQPCHVRVLLVTDGGLDYSEANFGLSTFVKSLLDATGPARFRITLGHTSTPSSASGMMEEESRIVARHTNFKFDDAAHFPDDAFDVVFLFGIREVHPGRGTASDGNPYPSDRLADPELQALAEFQNGGGGLFATGDHGALGRFLGQGLARARQMRLWDRTSSNDDVDEVSMTGPRRNDTNRIGDVGSQFDDQSDDIPQDITPRMYTSRLGFFRFSYPHPLLCGPNGVIRVMPDHPHEGECVEATDPNRTLDYTAPLGDEFPAATDGGTRPLPEVVSTSQVLSGTTSGFKDATEAHAFGGICAYDGHRASVGRVVTDATWHHFVNVNLVGDLGAPVGSIKRSGFLATPAGQAHFEEIKAYYRNLATWLSRERNLFCMNSRLLVRALFTDRVIEANFTTTEVSLGELEAVSIWHLGRYARDVLGRFAGRCQTLRLVLDLVWPEFDPELLPEIDPWLPSLDAADRRSIRKEVPFVDVHDSLDVALGAALVRLRESIDDPRDPSDEDSIWKLASKGASEGMRISADSLERVVVGAQAAWKR